MLQTTSHLFLSELLEIFDFEDLTFEQKSDQIHFSKHRLKTNQEFLFVKVFVVCFKPVNI